MDPNKLVKGPNTVSSRPVSTYADRRSTPASISSTTDALIQGWVIPDIPAADEAQKQDLSLSSWGQVLEEQVNQKLFREDVLEAMKKRAKTPMQSKTASSQRSNRSTLNPTEYMYELAAMTSAESPLWDFKEYKPKERLASSSEPQPGPASRKESFLQSIAIELEDPVIPRTESISLIEAPLPPIFESHAPVDDDDKSQQVKVEEKPTKVARAFSLTPLPPLPVTYSPPEAPIDMSALLKREDELMDELALKRRTLASVQGELEMLDEDLLLHDAQETLLIGAYQETMTQCCSLLSKLKTNQYISAKEIDNMVKCKTFYKLIVSPNPPLSRHLSKALNKMYGEEAEKFEMPTVASLTSRLGHEFGGSPRGGLGASGMGSKTNLVGSKNNLLGSVNVLAGGGGSAINLLGSYAELLQGGGSSMGLNSRGSFMNLGSRANLHG